MTSKAKPPGRSGQKPSSKSGSADLALWRRVVEGTKPMAEQRRRRRTLPQAAEVAVPPAAPKPGQAKATSKTPASPVAARPARPTAPKPVELTHGSASGLDRRSAERLRRGKLPVEARIDLHGLDQTRAEAALEDFLGSAQAQGRRCVLVVTGKGLSRPDGGVLRQAVPRWLNKPPNRQRVLSFSYAQPRDGGMGALYILLRRRRDD